MIQEQIQQSIERFNSLSNVQKQIIWNQACNQLAKVDIQELSLEETTSLEAGGWIQDLVDKVKNLLDITDDLGDDGQRNGSK